MPNATILLIEDNPLTRKLVRAALAKEGWSLLEATTAAAAIALVDNKSDGSAEEARIDLVLLDLVLPDKSGYELVRELRALPKCHGVPILAFTGLLSQAEEAKALNAGFDGFVAKPIEPSQLRHIIRGHLPAQTAARTALGAGKRLLIADDNAQQLKLARYRLGRLGFEVQAVGDGIEAVEAAKSARPDVIVTDALMPRLDGFGVCLRVREDPALADVPLVLVTSSYLEAADRELAARVGADAYVVRTADLADVIAALEEIFRSGAPRRAVATASARAGEVDAVRSQRALQQLERQVTVNSGLMQRCSTLSAELSVLTTVADALVEMRDVEGALRDILANCLDVAGASRGAIFTREPDESFALRAEHGFALHLAELHDLARRPGLAERAEACDESFEIAFAGTHALAVPMRGRTTLRGLLVLDAPRGAAKDDWRAFAIAIGAQVNLALALADAFGDAARSQAHARSLMESANDAIFVIAADGRVLEVNRAAERLLGLSESRIVDRDVQEFLPGYAIGEGVGRRLPAIRDFIVRKSDGAEVPVQVSSSLVDAEGERFTLAIARDVSEQRALESQLRQAQKMEAVGRLAGGVAHDFNNMLSVIIGYSNLVLEELEPGSAMAADVLEVKKAGERAADLTRQLLAFSRQQVLQARVLSINEVVSGMEKMAHRLIGEDIELNIALDPGAGSVRADLGQMNQVLMNLVVNARDAMEQGGRLSIETSSTAIDDEDTEPRSRSVEGMRAPGGYAVISVSDTGTGMDAATVARIFEPFFTTKEAGRGTGLGLATVLGIVEQSGGKVLVETAPGNGSTFRVCLPRVDAAPAEVDSSVRPAAERRGTETILLVEDEEAVRVLVRELLKRAGYRVLEAPSAGEALLIEEQHTEPIDLVLSDAVMPRMSGAQLVERLRARRPDLKVVIMSGYSALHGTEHALPGVPFLQKPITPEALARKVRAVLDGTPDD